MHTKSDNLTQLIILLLAGKRHGQYNPQSSEELISNKPILEPTCSPTHG